MRPRAWKSALSLLVVLLVVPATIVLCMLFERRLYVLASVAVIVLAMVPFFVSFERRKPQAREVVALAVMVALAIASRAAFAFVPFLKPMAAIVMICGIAFGSSSGFLAGALAALVSNFIFGQGPWTPWQMLSFGLCGYVFGLLAEYDAIPRARWSTKVKAIVSACGGLFVLVVAGPVLDSSSLFWMLGTVTPEAIAAVFLAGVPINAMHGAATAIVLFFLADPLLARIRRLQRKYGMEQPAR